MECSVLMSVYGKEKAEYLREALESIFAQTLKPSEIVLIKDGLLTDELEEVIDDAKKRYTNLRIWQFDQNVQLGRALAKGVELCSCDLIARMDTDDIAEKNRLQVQCEYMMANPKVDVCGGFIEEFQDDDKTNLRMKKMPVTESDILRYSRYRNPMNHMTIMFRKQAVLDAGNYRHFPFLEDYDLWMRMLAGKKHLINLAQVLVKVRVNDNMYARRGGFRYCKQYFRLRNNQRKLRLLSGREYIVACVLTIGITLIPVNLRRKVYQKILR